MVELVSVTFVALFINDLYDELVDYECLLHTNDLKRFRCIDNVVNIVVLQQSCKTV